MEVPGDDLVVRSIEGVLEGRPDGAKLCLNCGSELAGTYCGACGQKAGDLHVTLGEFLREALDSLFSFDSRFWSSLRPLLFKPGWLTTEYWAGRRARYLPPLRLYLFISFVTFLAAGLMSGDAVLDTSGDPDSKANVRVTVSEGARDEDGQIDWSAFGDGPGPVRWFGQNVLRPAVEEPERTRSLFLQRLPWAIFLLVPFFAALLRWLYRKRERYFVPHLVFALHFHAAVFVYRALGQLVDRLTGIEAVSSVAALVAMIYLFLALRRVFGDSRGVTLAKQVVLLMIYALALTIVMFVLLGLTTMSLS